MTVSFVLLIIAMLAVVGFLFLGLFSMARGGEFNRKYGNIFMRYRVAAQLVAVLLFLLFIMMSHRN
jgi:hypoxia induced protein